MNVSNHRNSKQSPPFRQRDRESESVRVPFGVIESAWMVFFVSLSIRIIFLILVSQNYTAEEYWGTFADSRFFIDVAEFFRDGLPTHEESLILVGPGFGFAIFAATFLAGANTWAILLINVIISALSCVLVRSLALRLGLSVPQSAIAGYICAFSLSSISYSCILYSETLFIFLTLLTIHSFLSAVRSGQLSHGLAFACLCASAAMVRSPGQFYPIIFAALLVFLALRERRYIVGARRKILPLLQFAFVALAATLILVWPIRNYFVHGIFTISETGVRAARKYWVASALTDSHEREPITKLRREWDRELASLYAPRDPTLYQRHKFDFSVIRDTLYSQPAPMIGGYLENAWANMTCESHIQRVIVPQLDGFWNFLSKRLTSNLGPFIVALNFLGLIVMFRRGLTVSAALIGGFYLYHALITGASFWQASRLFLPALPFWSIGSSVAVHWVVIFVRKRFPSFRRYLKRPFPTIC